MPFIRIDDRPYHYEDRGEGIPLLLLHGIGVTSESFWPLLETPPAGVRLIAPDHRGFGQSAPAETELTMAAMAEDALALLDALAIPRAIVCGMSMGGYVAMALTGLAAARVDALVLLDTQASADTEADRVRREAVARDAETNGLGRAVDMFMPMLLTPNAPADVRARLDAMMRAQSPAAMATASRALARRPDSFDILRRFTRPCLVLVGADDPLTPVAKSEELVSLLPHATFEVLANASHAANLEQPERVRDAIERFVARVREAQS